MVLTDEVIKKGQSRESGNMEHTRRRKTKQKNTTQKYMCNICTFIDTRT